MTKRTKGPGNSKGSKKAAGQGGGTVLGLIIGLVVGLGIAVVVALAITKTPMPFSSRSTKAERPEVAVDKGADPNKPLYGNREPAHAGVPAAAPVPENSAAPPASPNQPPVEAVVIPGAQESGAEGKAPIVEKSTNAKKADNGAAPKAGPSGGEAADAKYTYYLQAGAFRGRTDAENTRARLALLGFEAQVSERQTDNGTMYRVRVGPFERIEEMNRMRSRLSDEGVDAAVVRVPR
ncbi:MAG: SPOR domain-containing protein [Burkholderiaceae bacterium]